MNLLAHDQVWSADDWWTTAVAIPSIFVLALAFMGCVAAYDRDWEAVKFGALFLGSVCGVAYLFIWALVGISWLFGWL